MDDGRPSATCGTLCVILQGPSGTFEYATSVGAQPTPGLQPPVECDLAVGPNALSDGNAQTQREMTNQSKAYPVIHDAVELLEVWMGFIEHGCVALGCWVLGFGEMRNSGFLKFLQ